MTDPQVRRFLSLRTQVAFITVAGTIAISVVVTIIFNAFFTDQQREGLLLKGKALARLVAANISAAVDFDDAAAAGEVLKGVAQDDDVVYAAAIKPDATVFSYKGELVEDKLLRYNAGMTEARIGDRYIHVVQPLYIQKRRAAVVQIGLSLRRVEKAQRWIRVAGFGACLLLTVVFTAYFSYMIGRTVIRPIEGFKETIQRIGQGELWSTGRDGSEHTGPREIAEIHQALSLATGAFVQNIQAIRTAASELSKSAADIDKRTTELRKAADRQASSIDESAQAMEEATRTGQRSKQTADAILKTADQSLTVTQAGTKAVSDSSGQIEAIKKQVDLMVEAIERFDTQLSEVDVTIASVTDVASSSQMLAINASIEAAKAGEAGQGFEVVAKEVRRLSQQSKAATEEVRETLGGIQNAVSELAELSEASRERTDRGIESIEHTGGVINKLRQVIEENSNAARQIGTAVTEQVTGFTQMSVALQQVRDLAQENLGSIGDLKDLGEQLAATSVQMEAMIARFKLRN